MASISTVKMKGPSGNLITVNESDVEIYEQKGYKLFVESKSEQPQPRPLEQAIESMTIAELKQYAECNDIDISGLTKKQDIIDTIRQEEAERNEDSEQE